VAVKTDWKQEVVSKYQTHPDDVGSPEVQIALLTRRIADLTEHLKIHSHDYHTRRGLLKLVGQRRSMQRYLAKKSPERYRALVASLGLRR